MDSNNEYKKQAVFKEVTDEEDDQSDSSESKTDTGLEQNIVGLLCYLFWFITGIIFLLIEKENRFVRFHAMQSIIVSVPLFIISFILTVIPIIGLVIGMLASPLILVLWVFMMYKAYKGEWFKLPIVGDIAEQQIDKLAN